ncbi:MAG: MBL fold metallo-hydrolase [Candidatus Bathyarchaeia archaeon]
MLKIVPLLNKAILSTSILVNWEGFLFLLDIGPGSTIEMINRRIKTSRVKAILITHSHIDHFWDLVPFLWLRRLRDQKDPLRIFCPKPYTNLFEWCVEITKTRNFASIQAINGSSKIELDNLIIQPFQVEHANEEMALGYAITEKPKTKLLLEKLRNEKIPIEIWREIAKGEKVCLNGRIIMPEEFSYKKQRKIVYSGDTRPCEALKRASENVDLLMIEATYVDEKFQETASKKGHTTIREALKIAFESGAKGVLLTHIPLNNSLEKVLQEAERIMKDIKNPPKLFLGVEEITIS